MSTTAHSDYGGALRPNAKRSQQRVGRRTGKEPSADRRTIGGAERSGRRWRARCAKHWENGIECSYKGHTIIIERENDEANWYITVTEDASGSYAYDGWWRDSRDRSIADAVEEALRGSLLIGGGAEHGGSDGESKSGACAPTIVLDGPPTK